MLPTLRHNDTDAAVAAAKLLTGFLRVSAKIADPDAFLRQHSAFDAEFVAHICTWQRNHGLTPDGVIGPATWRKITAAAPTCSTSKNRISAAAAAVQLLLGSANLTADGVYGSRTKNAVAAFQSARGLTADGFCGPKTWAALITGEAAKPAAFKQPVDFKQYDSRWAKKMFSSIGDDSQTMKSSGCGPTAAADVVATLKDGSVTPWTLAQIAMNKGYRTASNGTAWAFFKYIAGQYGFSKFVQTSSLATLKACLDAGGYVVCSMGKGYWTSGGHYICAWKYDGTYIYCNDPASSKRTRQNQTDFLKQRKQFFCFWP